MTIGHLVDPGPFEESVRRQLSLGVAAEPSFVPEADPSREGRPTRRVLRIKGRRIVGYALRIEGLTAEESLRRPGARARQPEADGLRGVRAPCLDPTTSGRRRETPWEDANDVRTSAGEIEAEGRSRNPTGDHSDRPHVLRARGRRRPLRRCEGPTRLGRSWLRFFGLDEADFGRFRRHLRVAAAAHDWGKANDGFQDAVTEGGEQVVRHEHLSGLLLAEMLADDKARAWLAEAGIDEVVLLAAVISHHVKVGQGPPYSGDKYALGALTGKRESLSFLFDHRRLLGSLANGPGRGRVAVPVDDRVPDEVGQEDDPGEERGPEKDAQAGSSLS